MLVGPTPLFAAAPRETVIMAVDESTVTPGSDAVEADSPAPPAPAVDRATLVSKVEKGLAALRASETGTRDSEPEPEIEEPVEDAESPTDDSNDPAPDDEPADEDSKPSKDESEDEPKEEAEQPQPKRKGPTLPDSYRRSLKAYDWSDADIDAALKSDPVNFTLTAQRIHANRNAELAKWAEMGRASRPEQENEDKPAKTVDRPKHLDEKGLFKPLDVDGMVEKFGNEDLVRQITEPVNELLKQVNALLPDLMSGVQSIKQSKTDNLARQIDGFFGGKDLKSYEKMYGKDGKTATDEQIESRNKVLEMADALMAGASMQHRKLSFSEAMLMAHDSVSIGFKTQAVREEIKSKVEKRGNSVSLRPSKGGKATKTGTPTRPELEARVKSSLAGMFGS